MHILINNLFYIYITVFMDTVLTWLYYAQAKDQPFSHAAKYFYLGYTYTKDEIHERKIKIIKIKLRKNIYPTEVKKRKKRQWRKYMKYIIPQQMQILYFLIPSIDNMDCAFIAVIYFTLPYLLLT